MTNENKQTPEKQHLFDKKANVIRVLVGLFTTCVLLFLSDFLFVAGIFDKHAHFNWENWPGFYAMYGFVACVILVLVSKYILRPLVKRDEDYYDK